MLSKLFSKQDYRMKANFYEWANWFLAPKLVEVLKGVLIYGHFTKECSTKMLETMTGGSFECLSFSRRVLELLLPTAE